jgi:F-box-like
MLLPYPDPPTETTINDARRDLALQRDSLVTLSQKIDQAEGTLAQIIAESKCAISEMQRERSVLEDKMFHTKAYIAPIRRLPNELLRHIFMFNFEDYPCCAWVLAAVNSLWRRLALSVPKLWSKVCLLWFTGKFLTYLACQIRLVTTQNSSADTIRLWLERSGDTVPLDIEIFLRVNGASSEPTSRARSVSPSPWAPYPHPGGSASATYVIAQPSHTGMAIPILPPSHTPIIIPPSPSHHDSWSSPPHPSSPQPPQSKSGMHWGHIAIFYLVQQMYRWERFVFRFDKQFSSMAALKSITG